MQIPRDCEDLATTVPAPRPALGENAKLTLARTTGALTKANRNLVATRTCQQNQRERFAGN